jgi:twitching motility protein PilT
MAFALDDLLMVVAESSGSDLHLTAGLPPVARINGRLQRLAQDDLTPSDMEVLVRQVLTEKQAKVLDERNELDFAFNSDKTRFRVNIFRQRGSLAAVFRVIPPTLLSFAELGLPVETMEGLSILPRGLVVVTGPTGSGKSTTLAAMIDFINENRDCHVITVEDPIEFHHRHKKSIVNQREVGPDTASFAEALKYVLRQDPDVILVGEMRDLETVRAALTAAETGHLVLTTLHTQDAIQTIDRIIDVFPSEQQQQVRVQLASTLQAVVSQQLIRTEGAGRTLVNEVLIANPAVRNLIREGKAHQITTVLQTGQRVGMHTMDQSLADAVRDRKISMECAIEAAVDPGSVRMLVTGRA